MTYAVLFPGQGSQAVGMCPDIRRARPDLFDEASSILGWDLEETIAEGPDDVLISTERAQPALYVTAYALWDEFASLVDGDPVAMAGHSLGEYTALAAAGALGFLDGVSLVATRGIAMAEAAARNPSGMAAVIGAELQDVEEVTDARRSAGGRLYVANINAPGQIVVAGGHDDIDWLVQHARDVGLRRVVRLNVAGGFHSPLMASARESLEAALASTRFHPGQSNVFANATATVTEDPATTLATQLTEPVRFSETLQNMAAAGVDVFVHIGPGDVTAGLARRTVPDAEVHVVSSLTEARAIAELLSVQ
jgi:[acyl-carrier-protein] S-malonyltransferase